jgi:hypothetical protein
MKVEEGRLWGQGEGQPKFELLPESETKYITDFGVSLSFELDQSGEAVAFVIGQSGQTRRAKRVK